ncbi:uncharacterized protein AKAW2_30408A [Aspergillus luchuensis]|uniref:Uncharacterized protein n=1 Tax=Aspergillus kawachii TaxID=1069201 RepID=A0A7R7W6T0_ASPKA|nr:uncharacterized protein AKAW2_30408A [Aspergillus luchuensis]BCR97089.1 hypothetical protein AKAW2_30408A [Aspergillus luchuensis]BCS09563.1 hypothetical protein ALUC_30380A [Aspergillus luchuensis]
MFHKKPRLEGHVWKLSPHRLVRRGPRQTEPTLCVVDDPFRRAHELPLHSKTMNIKENQKVTVPGVVDPFFARDINHGLILWEQLFLFCIPSSATSGIYQIA